MKTVGFLNVAATLLVWLASSPLTSGAENPGTPPSAAPVVTIPPAPPQLFLPSGQPARPPAIRTNLIRPSVARVVGTNGGVSARPSVNTATVPADWLKFEAREKTYHAKLGDTVAKFSFAVTNIGKGDVVIQNVQTSCGCTAAKLPQQPWTLTPNSGGEIGFTIDLAGKSGKLTKTATVYSSAGPATLVLNVNIPAGNMGGPNDRAKNLQIAAADRQAVFRNDCASCHVTPTVGKTGKELYTAACGICHDAEHRASFVPNLRTLNKPTDHNYWLTWATYGREGSLMPAFSSAKGGPLSESQIQSLAEYLQGDFKTESTIVRKPTPALPTLTPGPIQVPINPGQ